MSTPSAPSPSHFSVVRPRHAVGTSYPLHPRLLSTADASRPFRVRDMLEQIVARAHSRSFGSLNSAVHHRLTVCHLDVHPANYRGSRRYLQCSLESKRHATVLVSGWCMATLCDDCFSSQSVIRRPRHFKLGRQDIHFAGLARNFLPKIENVKHSCNYATCAPYLTRFGTPSATLHKHDSEIPTPSPF
ncbi:hypothetical protein P153DRAFT_147706 [Dothidotthia symphoricarpi CBS 119687]|uniref:Uncharacterized protein n=1 Tax=Dothidotthia symphoricarpi CBS 119687 TaxID=1392245 RepID=A0A6A5ZXQ9_9PLEO|nr:uncharacterized protein P153DRAFT_147706 [Dothidotthia symphoricarpi CBS 119687]KAF2123693.1 hypothetical protein P153DRAFT_147706 [Dothidotthia symphoricarpi CBS 119687]